MGILTKLFRKNNLNPNCSVCNKYASKILLKENSKGVFHLTYSGPGGSSGSPIEISQQRAKSIREAFTKPYVFEKIKEADFYDDAGYCIECGKFYCTTHWHVSATGGGHCPEGHFKSLDPHY